MENILVRTYDSHKAKENTIHYRYYRLNFSASKQIAPKLRQIYCNLC